MANSPELEVFTCAQSSPEWFACRAGIPTASEFSTVMASGKGGGESKTRLKYLRTLAGEIITGKCVDGYTNIHMERGHEMEAEARDLYAMVADADPTQVGFLRRGRAGASPDSLVGADGVLEIKTKLPHLQIEVLTTDAVPSEHIAQCQGQLWISGRSWVDFVSYWPGLPLFVKRVQRDEAYIAKIKVAVDDFLGELDALVEKIKQYRSAA
ncbi:MAG: YqaJ viral recombinase family protein [Patescibacteria group bacterium]|nr:YqaJ viral recombinase family protein [Patescibacteria group bacterium]